MSESTAVYTRLRVVLDDLSAQIQQAPSIQPPSARHAILQPLRAQISSVTRRLADAAPQLAAYDQRTLATALKQLADDLDACEEHITPRQKFRFRRPLYRDTDAQSRTTEDTRRFVRDETMVHPTPVSLATDNPQKDNQKDHQKACQQQPPNKHGELVLADVHDAIYSLAHDADTFPSLGRLMRVENMVFDLLWRPPPPGVGTKKITFYGFAGQSVRRCVVLLGHVQGSLHITDIHDSVVIVAAHQVRMHECSNIDVYLHCPSHPIVEDCVGLRVAPLDPTTLAMDTDNQTNDHNTRTTDHNTRTTDHNTEHQNTGGHNDQNTVAATPNLWNRVDDFHWLKPEPSPNWSEIPPAERVPTSRWHQLHQAISRAEITTPEQAWAMVRQT